jgi:acyl carrier protein
MQMAMCPASAEPRLAEAFRTALELPPEVQLEQLAYGGHPHWDSVGHIALVAEIEDAYGVMLEPADVSALSSWPRAVELVERLEVPAPR